MPTVKKRFYIIILAGLAALAGGFLIETSFSFITGWPLGHTQKGHLLGWLGLGIMLLVFGYSVKKRFGRLTGWPKAWFWLHQLAGIIAPVLIIVHAGPHFHALVPSLALVAMLIVTLSGLTGAMVHRKALMLLNAERKALLDQGLTKLQAEALLYDLAAEEAGFKTWRLIHVPVATIFMVLLAAHIGGALYFGGL